MRVLPLLAAIWQQFCHTKSYSKIILFFFFMNSIVFAKFPFFTCLINSQAPSPQNDRVGMILSSRTSSIVKLYFFIFLESFLICSKNIFFLWKELMVWYIFLRQLKYLSDFLNIYCISFLQLLETEIATSLFSSIFFEQISCLLFENYYSSARFWRSISLIFLLSSSSVGLKSRKYSSWPFRFFDYFMKLRCRRVVRPSLSCFSRRYRRSRATLEVSILSTASFFFWIFCLLLPNLSQQILVLVYVF